MTSADERIARLERQVEALLAKVDEQAAEIAALRAENAELRRRLGENSSNSNKPPSTDSPADRNNRDQFGRLMRGHQAPLLTTRPPG